jgi:spore germination protein YaaH
MRSKVSVLVLLFVLAALPGHAYRMAIWVPPWDANALTTIQRQAGNLDESNPVWYTLSATGVITKNWNAENPTLRAALTGTRLLPTIQNYVNGSFDGALLGRLVATGAAREAHAEAIRSLVVTNAFDGIDLDYESISAANKDNYSLFVTLLAEKLHAAGKQLSITVPAKDRDSATWNGPGGTDYAAIGRVADSVKVMAYDYHWDGSDPGALTPLAWLDAVVTYAKGKMTPSKVLIGLPWYGYDWQGTDAKTMSYAGALAIAQSKGITPVRDANGEMTFAYDGRTVFYQDAQSFQLKADAILKKHPTIGGFTAWAVGTEDPETWARVSALRSNPSTNPATPVVADFALNGPSTVSVNAGATAVAAVGIVPVNGFGEAVNVTVAPLDGFASYSLSASTIRYPEKATLTVATPLTMVTGNYRYKMTFTSGTLVHEQIVTLAVTSAGADFSIASATGVSAVVGQTLATSVGVTPILGFSGSVTATARGLDGFVGTLAFSTSTVAAGANTNFLITPSASLRPAIYRVVVRFESGSLVHEKTIRVTVVSSARRRAA